MLFRYDKFNLCLILFSHSEKRKRIKHKLFMNRMLKKLKVLFKFDTNTYLATYVKMCI